jgi:hypothetical protein
MGDGRSRAARRRASVYGRSNSVRVRSLRFRRGSEQRTSDRDPSDDIRAAVDEPQRAIRAEADVVRPIRRHVRELQASGGLVDFARA